MKECQLTASVGPVLVGPDAGGVGRDVRDEGVLVGGAEEVRHGAAGEDAHVLPAVRLRVPRRRRSLLELEALDHVLV